MSDRVMSAGEPPMGGIGLQPDRLASTSPAKVEDLAPYSVTTCYANPNEILKSPKLSRRQKRELLCKWAFDAYRVEVTETGGIPPCSPSRLDEVIDALIDLDVGSVASVSKVLRKSPPETRDTAEASMRCQPLIESERVEGTTVMIRRERIIGSIKRLMIEKISSRVAYSVMSFGGFLGMGTEEHSIPWNKLTYDTRLGGYRTDITEQQLRGAPAFSRDRNYEWKDRIENASCTTTMVRHTTGDPRSPKQELALASVRWIASAWHQHG